MNSNQFLFLLLFLSLLLSQALAQKTITTFNVGVILDLDQMEGKVRLRCMSMALSDFYTDHTSYRTRIVLHPRNFKNDNLAVASAALDLLKNTEVQAIIVPDKSAQTNFVADLGNRTHVPILSFSAISASLVQNPFLIRTVQNDSSQVKAICAIFQHFGWKEAIHVYEESDCGNQVISNFIDAFQQNDIQISYMSAIHSSATDKQIGEEVYKLMSMQAKVFIVHMSPSLGSRLFVKAKELGMMTEGYAFILTDGLSNVLDSMNPSVIEAMQGALGVRPYVSRSAKLESFTARWTNEFLQTTHVSLFGQWAYDTVWALALAAEKVDGLDHGFLKPKTIDNSNYLATLGVSKIGSDLVKAISKTSFKGLSGEFHLVDRQLQSSYFEIVNVIGKQGRQIGVWSPKSGIIREFNVTSETESSNYDNLRAIIWPGESTKVPKGWSFSTNGRTLKVGVATSSGFSEFVSVTVDPGANLKSVTGYCVDLFNAAMKLLSYEVPYEFIPFLVPNGTISSQRNDNSRAMLSPFDIMLHQVYLQKLDAVVADISITANRSLYVDFTSPFSETGVSMIVRTKDNQKKDAWVFLKPLSRGMWLISAATFVFTGCVIWILEHRVNTSFRGSLSEQLGMIFWFSFSTIVFAHRERVTSNLSRFVLIIWLFVVLILTSSYTANLTSMLTVQQLDVGNLNQLVGRGKFIGYQRYSYVKELLNHLNIDDSKLKALGNMDEYDEALSRGSERGGVSAIVDEIPYLKLFLKHCDKYVMVGPTYGSNGFGFVFRKGSPLVLDVSKAILELRETDEMRIIESKWFRNVTACEDQGSIDSPESLSVDRFRGLFLVTIITSICAVLIFLSFFLHEHINVLTNSRERSIGKKLMKLLKLFYQEEPSHDLKAIELSQVSTVERRHPLTSSAFDTSSSSIGTSEDTASISQGTTTSNQDEDAYYNEVLQNLNLYSEDTGTT